MSIGEDRVRISFNPSGDGLVNGIKQQTAKLINACAENKLRNGPDSEENRLWSLAMTAYEEAAMWAVKAATSGK